MPVEEPLWSYVMRLLRIVSLFFRVILMALLLWLFSQVGHCQFETLIVLTH